MQLVRVVLLLSLAGWCCAQAALSSPCPGLFQYEAVSGERRRWHGVISLPANTIISSLWLNLVLDTNAQSSWNGDIISENVEFKIEHIKRKTYPASAIEVRFYVNHYSGLVPKLAEIRLNDKEICNLKSRQSATTGQGTKGQEGTFYWIRLIGAQETKPVISGLSSPVNSQTGNVPTAYNEPDTNSWLSYNSGAPSAKPQVNVDQNWVGGISASGNGNSKIKHINMGIFPTPGTGIQFYVHYDPNLRISTITDIKLNGKEICNVETIQPASNIPVFKRGIASSAINTTPKSSWLSYIGWENTAKPVTRPPSRLVFASTSGQTQPIEKISPLGYSGPDSNNWLSYISVKQPPQPTSWSAQSTSKAQYPANSESFNQQQPDPNSWMSYISGSESPRAPSIPNGPVLHTQRPSYPVDQPDQNSWVSYISGPQLITPSPPVSPTSRPSYPVDQTYSTEFEIEDVEMRIYPAPATDIWFHVQYNPHAKIPKAVEIKLNGRDICNVGIAQPTSSVTEARGVAEHYVNYY